MDAPPQNDYHNYTVDWTQERIQWWLDGKMLRELVPAQALGGKNYPQTPMNIRMGIWAGGDTSNNDPGVVEWAGGETNFDEGPFIMTVQSIYAKDYTSASEYSWDNMDSSGSWEKVKVIAYVLVPLQRAPANRLFTVASLPSCRKSSHPQACATAGKLFPRAPKSASLPVLLAGSSLSVASSCFAASSSAAPAAGSTLLSWPTSRRRRRSCKSTRSRCSLASLASDRR